MSGLTESEEERGIAGESDIETLTKAICAGRVVERGRRTVKQQAYKHKNLKKSKRPLSSSVSWEFWFSLACSFFLALLTIRKQCVSYQRRRIAIMKESENNLSSKAESLSKEGCRKQKTEMAYQPSIQCNETHKPEEKAEKISKKALYFS